MGPTESISISPFPPGDTAGITQLLNSWSSGDPEAASRVMPLVDEERVSLSGDIELSQERTPDLVEDTPVHPALPPGCVPIPSQARVRRSPGVAGRRIPRAPGRTSPR